MKKTWNISWEIYAFVAGAFLMLCVFYIFWAFSLLQKFSDKLSYFWESYLSSNLYSTLTLTVVIVIVLIWWALQVIPKKQADRVNKTKGLIKATELFSIENEARKTLSQIIGGFVVIIGLFATAANLINTQRETEKNRTLALEGQITDRFTKAITQLGDIKLDVRLGGIYALERIAKDSAKDHWTMMEVLTAYVRENASRPKKELSAKKGEIEKPLADIQIILTVIGRRNPDGEKDNIDLNDTYLRMADLRGARLSGASFIKADLRGANFSKAYLSGANLSGANLSLATFSRAYLIKADLINANLSGSSLDETSLDGATFRGASLVKADLSKAIGLTWEQISMAIIYDSTKLPPEIEEEHKDELKKMREATKKQGKRN